MEFHDYFLLFWIFLTVVMAIFATRYKHKYLEADKEAEYWKGLHQMIKDLPYEYLIIDKETYEMYECKSEHERANVIKLINPGFISIRGKELFGYDIERDVSAPPPDDESIEDD